jgi:hypothetical protein
VNQLARKQSNISSTGSEADSLLDLYKQHVDSRNGAQAMGTGEKRKMSTSKQWQEVDVDDSNWIHRDKLAQIESRELEEAGFRVRRMSHSSSNPAKPREPSLDTNGEEQYNRNAGGEGKRQRTISPIAAEEYEPVEDERMNWDLRTPEEVAAEQEIMHTRSNSLRPSPSRIPISKSGHVPLPNEVVERDSPLPRSRQGSVGWNGSIQEPGISFSKMRARSASVNSQALLDDAGDDAVYSTDHVELPDPVDLPRSPSSPRLSPSKNKTPPKGAPAGPKKTTRSTSQSKNKPPQSPGKRPGTSGGGVSRPSTSHRPEGEAPWIATMYKPDPSLPPDQQIIPTHAKRIAQEQWEREGRTGSMYDREFRLLNTEEFSVPVTKSKSEEPEKKDEYLSAEKDPWPLPLPSPRSDRPSTSGTEHGGYKTMPTISSPKITQKPASPMLVSPIAPPREDVIRLEEPPEEEKKKGCCCIIM